MTFKTMATFSSSDALLYCFKTPFRALLTPTGVFDARYF